MNIEEHFRESAIWQDFQKALGRKVYTAAGDGWRYVAVLRHSGMFSRLYCDYGPVAESAEALRDALRSLKDLARKLGAVLVRVQPLGIEYNPQDYGMIKIPFGQPEYTRVLDLTQSEDEILLAMRKTNRNVYRNYHKKGMTYRESNNPAEIGELVRMLREVEEHNGLSFLSDEYYKVQSQVLMSAGNAKLHFIEYKNEIIAAAMTYDGPNTREYAHAGASHEHRQLAAPTALLVEMIMGAKRAGQKEFDFGGITILDDPTHKYYGFSQFKRSFGGEVKELSATYDIPVKKVTYLAYTALKNMADFVVGIKNKVFKR
ncbi:MAG: peptidoglycan bridge formation glycyltransferase FemA/FemB family protein [Microbacteriaceae bacterium]|nr:peptidoglycan bridge formation glycyltransferase FemA/FemB family protein [Microbacteriaceae bacterium]